MFQASSLNEQEAQLSWKIADDYYLYQQQFQVVLDGQPIKLELPSALTKDDPNFGRTEVYYNQVGFTLPIQANQTYQVRWQGCANEGLCYPPITRDIYVDKQGLIHIPAQAKDKSGLFSSSGSTIFGTHTSAANSAGQAATEEAALQAEDQKIATGIQQRSFILNTILFFGLGILLAFTPCSLPMLPIVSSLIVNNKTGIKAWLISLVFVLCMATVYALLGLLIASTGGGFQRALQQPAIIGLFSGLFIVLALNLFGLFDLNLLPQRAVNYINQLQARQKNGTLMGAAVMGILSALLVAPCMSAPLAGSLLYISYSGDAVVGATLLFCLGLGMGIPLIIACTFGAKYLPKPGLWMDTIKHVFGWIMLALALYFIRPLLAPFLFDLSIALYMAALWIYVFIRSKAAIQRTTKPLMLAAQIILLLTIGGTAIYLFYQSWLSYQHSKQSLAVADRLQWQRVTTLEQFNSALAQARQAQKPVVIDIYADWCVACQPIEKYVLPNPAVQQKLQSYSRIKVDLTQFNGSQQAILNQYQVMGPPTFLFLQADGQEKRHLRLTGSFSTKDLMSRLP
ncbi:protein-disulfide reductase DsbD [Alkanindiges sp. WGS2144]|uniref:protein-disulfide reductase DsbD n=1 Tax=Alkanindiges sp. WGS2144 TaxID=3366808 RepID=UPI00375233F3